PDVSPCSYYSLTGRTLGQRSSIASSQWTLRSLSINLIAEEYCHTGPNSQACRSCKGPQRFSVHCSSKIGSGWLRALIL
ncbi:unnamed protein product, partial [Mycena citricolor]